MDALKEVPKKKMRVMNCKSFNKLTNLTIFTRNSHFFY